MAASLPPVARSPFLGSEMVTKHARVLQGRSRCTDRLIGAAVQGKFWERSRGKSEIYFTRGTLGIRVLRILQERMHPPTQTSRTGKTRSNKHTLGGALEQGTAGDGLWRLIPDRVGRCMMCDARCTIYGSMTKRRHPREPGKKGFSSGAVADAGIP